MKLNTQPKVGVRIPSGAPEIHPRRAGNLTVGYSESQFGSPKNREARHISVYGEIGIRAGLEIRRTLTVLAGSNPATLIGHGGRVAAVVPSFS